MKYKYRKDYYYKGKRIQAYGNTLNDFTACMKRKEAKVDEELKRGTGKVKYRDYSEECFEVYGANKGTRSAAKHHVYPHIGAMSLNMIKPKDVQLVLNKAKDYSRPMMYNILRALREVFRHAVVDGLIPQDPTQAVTVPPTTVGKRRALEAWEREAVIKTASKNRQFYCYLLMMLCGCRPTEAYKAKREDISIIDGTPALHIRGTKTKLSDRYVPLPKDLYEILIKVPQNEYLSLSAHGTPLRTVCGETYWQTFVRQVNVDLGCETWHKAVIDPIFGEDLVPYNLRHEYCTELARKGIDIRIAQRLMGHATIGTTANVYTNLHKTDIIAQAKILSEEELCS